MSAPSSGPYSAWVTEDQVRACCPDLNAEFDLTESIDFASGILFRLSGCRYPGTFTRTVHPCYGSNGGCSGASFGGDWWWSGYPYPTIPARVNGEWFNFGLCGGKCNLPSIRIPGPIVSVEEIVIDGEILDPSAYRVEGYRVIRRLDGRSWPCTNDLAEPSDAVDGVAGTWEITYTYGRPVPPDALLPAAMFACQIAKARCGATDCQLPQRLTEIVRSGVKLFFADPLQFLDKGQVGIYEVDLWLRSVNPNGLQRRSTVRRADDAAKTTVWTT